MWIPHDHLSVTLTHDGAARAKAPGCQQSSCGSVRRGRGGDRCNQRCSCRGSNHPRSPALRNDPGTVMIPQYQFNKTKQHTQCAASGDERTWSASTNADAAEVARHTTTSRYPRVLFLPLVPPRARGVAHARCARHRHALRTRVSAPQTHTHCPLACFASSCSVINATDVQTSSTAR